MGTIIQKLRKLADMLRKAFETPEQILKILGFFRELLGDDSNFIDVSKWGIKDEAGRKVVPFSFSDKGLAKVDAFSDSYEPFRRVNKSGRAGIHGGEVFCLPYFLSQFLVTLPMFVSGIEYMPVKTEEEKRVREGLVEKFKPLQYQINTMQFYKDVPHKAYTKEERNRIQGIILGIIHQIENEYKQVAPLTPEEEAFIKRS